MSTYLVADQIERFRKSFKEVISERNQIEKDKLKFEKEKFEFEKKKFELSKQQEEVCKHDWQFKHGGTLYDFYTCSKCGLHKVENHKT